MDKDRNDYELAQEEWERSDERVFAGLPDDELEQLYSDLDAQDETRRATRYGVFDLQYPATCDKCKQAITVGTRVVGRKLEGRWLIEELSCA